MRLFNVSIGFLLLAIYLILVGLATILPEFHVPAIVTGVIALVSGILILIGR